MQIPAATIATVIAASLAKGIAGSAATSNVPPAQQSKAAFIFGLAATAATLSAGYYMGGMTKPNSIARGLLWSGGFSAVFTAGKGIGLLSGATAPAQILPPASSSDRVFVSGPEGGGTAFGVPFAQV